MILSWFTSAGNNLIEKTKNPFLGTFTFVWLARNWELVFALFNFDDSYTLDSKIGFLSERIAYDTFWTEVGWNIFWTFLVLILTYLLINIARAISNLFEKRLSPLIYKWTDYKSLVPKSEYQSILTRMNDLRERLDKEIQERLKAQSERDEFEEKYNIELLEKVESPKDELNKSIKSENEKIEYSNTDLFGGFNQEDFIYTLNLVRNQNTIWPNTKYEVIALKLFELGHLGNKRVLDNGTYYTLTKKGESLLNEIKGNQVDTKLDNEYDIETDDEFFNRIVNEYSYDTISDFFFKSQNGIAIDKSEIKKLEYLIDELKDMGFILLKSVNENSQKFKITEDGELFIDEYFNE